jgi:hypothetical protein
MVKGSKTISLLKAFLQTKEGGGWVKPWGSVHVTLGNLKPPDLADPEIFKKERSWYIQLVKHNSSSGWLPHERILLCLANGAKN